ncbi:uncharacterized protein LOC105190316 isoform X1 [Harpegnathos saltator]|uniref:uncharacterized protein LOC105190316 isoform X1 n=1 Tax=Harpegnathos saltator TaxID=610380 RepID=UPI000DBED1B0|nr:uncharacterized protein LOC105190316 isoform X1 [Harpegnathos saltator]
MAKKTVPATLQTEVLNDEEWGKILKRKGLVVVDVYSDWSGPCTGMVSTLKKIKMEIGGDALSYATASCDRVTDLQRFQGKSEPTWMFIHEGRMINLMFGAHCPQLVQMLTTELERVQHGDEHEFSIDVSERSPEEVIRLKIHEEARIAKETARRSRKGNIQTEDCVAICVNHMLMQQKSCHTEAEAKARYEAEMLHLTTSLCNETCLLLFPWIFKDEEGRRRDKKSSPPYVELVEELLPEHYTVEQELRKRLNEDLLHQMLDEVFFFSVIYYKIASVVNVDLDVSTVKIYSFFIRNIQSTYSFSEYVKQLLLDGKCMFMRLKIVETREDLDVHNYLFSLLFNQPMLPESEDDPSEDCYAGRHCPAFEVPDKENKKFPFIWSPPNPRNKAVVFRTIFNVYTNTTYPYEDKMANVPIIVFKYDYTRKNDLKMVLEMFNDDIIEFGVFEYDKPPEAKMIAKSIEAFEMSTEEKTGYFVFRSNKNVHCNNDVTFSQEFEKMQSGI